MHAATDEEENANELRFGDVDFDKVQSLTNDEMYYLLTKRIENGYNNELVSQTYAYLDRVATSKVSDELEVLTMQLGEKLRNIKLFQADNAQKSTPLHAFEVASLANLIKEDDVSPDEVFSLLPSMKRFGVDQVQRVIELVVDAKAKTSSVL
eukprot:gene7983-8628_t